MCTLDYDDAAAIWEETPHRSQKERTCDACCATIPKGSAYLSHKSLFDGIWTNENMCFGCWLAREAFAEAHGQSMVPSALLETLRECMLRVPAWERRQITEPDRWASELASVLRRYRTSATNRRHLAWLWLRRALQRERLLTLRVINRRTQLPGARADN